MSAVPNGIVVPCSGLISSRIVVWDSDRSLFDLLYREIETDGVNCSPVLRWGTERVVFWCSDEGLLRVPVKHNGFATELAHRLGWYVPVLADNVVITGGPDRGDGNALGVSEFFANWVDSTIGSLISRHVVKSIDVDEL